MNTIASEFIAQSIHRIELNTPRIKKCLDELTEDEVWYSPNTSLNSIGNLTLHLCGNITQYIISSIGGEPDNRERDKEFSAIGSMSKKELFGQLETTVGKAITIIQNCDEESLLKTRRVQGFSYTGMGNIIHVTEHYSYHTGQIAMLTKLIKNKDLGFYAGMNLNIKNR